MKKLLLGVVAMLLLLHSTAAAQFVTTYNEDGYKKGFAKLQVFGEMHFPTKNVFMSEYSSHPDEHERFVVPNAFVRGTYFIKDNVETVFEFNLRNPGLTYAAARTFYPALGGEASVLAGIFKSEHSDIYPGPDSLRLSELPATGTGFDDGVLGIGVQLLRGDWIVRAERYTRKFEKKGFLTRTTTEASIRYKTASFFINDYLGHGAVLSNPNPTPFIPTLFSFGWTYYDTSDEHQYFARADLNTRPNICFTFLYNFGEVTEDYYLIGLTYEYSRASFIRIYYNSRPTSQQRINNGDNTGFIQVSATAAFDIKSMF